MCAAAARRERNDAKGDERRAKCEKREEGEAGEGRRQRGEERRAASRHGEELCATAARREKESGKCSGEQPPTQAMSLKFYTL